MSVASDRSSDQKALRAADGAFCEARLEDWLWLTPGFVGTAKCLRCKGAVQVDLSDRARLVKCVSGCGSSWTLAGLCRDFGWPSPPSAIL